MRIDVRRGWMGLLALVLAGCAHFQDAGPAGAEPPRPDDDLSDGYSLLYEAVSGLRHGDKLFWVKFESDGVEQTIRTVSDYAAELAGDLERVERDFPAVEINRQPLPLLEQRKRAALQRSNLQRLAPVVGESGAVFERTVLLSTSGALNQLRVHARVMADLESDPALQAILRDAEREFSELYIQVVDLLNARYFRHDTFDGDAAG